MAATGLTQRERTVLRYHGMPARDVARVLMLTVHEVLEIRMTLRERGAAPTSPALEREPRQLSFGETERMMRTNRAPQPASAELGWTTGTDPAGW